MQITLELPDEIARQLAAGQDLSRIALEGLVAEGCRAHRSSDHQAADLLGLSRYKLDGFLKAHGVFPDYSMEDFEREAALERAPVAEGSGRDWRPPGIPG